MKRGDVAVGPWPGGVNNVAKEDAVPKDQLRSAQNVDIDNEGNPQLRAGRVNVVAATRTHSLFLPLESPYLYANNDGDLRAYNPDFVATTIRAGIGPRYCSYAQVNDDIYWTNSQLHRRFGLDLVDRPGGLDTPHPPIATATAAGGLAAGAYWVALTWLDDEGRESGASPPLEVDVPANGGIALTGLPAAAETAETLCIYVAPRNEREPVLYLAATRPAGVSSANIGAHVAGRPCDTLWHMPLPPGQIVRYGHGRRCVASGNTLAWTEGLRPDLMHHDNSIRFGQYIAMLEPVGEGNDGAGFYLSDHQRVYFIAGNGPGTWSKQIRRIHAAVEGSSCVVPGDAFGLDTTAPCALWLGVDGVFCLGTPGGSVLPLTQGRLALDPAQRGAAAFREFDGIKQIFTTFLVGGGNAFGVRDSAVATITRNGVTVE